MLLKAKYLNKDYLSCARTLSSLSKCSLESIKNKSKSGGTHKYLLLDFKNEIHNSKIYSGHLLDNTLVRKWINAEFPFNILHKIQKEFPLSTKDTKEEYKNLERKWMTSIVEKHGWKPCGKMVSGQFGHLIGYELYKSIYSNLTHENETRHKLDDITYNIDIENEDMFIEIKSSNYTVTGTAYEKITHVPFKYINLVENTKKSLKILCLGDQEVFCSKKRNNYFDPEPESGFNYNFIQMIKNYNMEYIRGSDMLKLYDKINN